MREVKKFEKNGAEIYLNIAMDDANVDRYNEEVKEARKGGNEEINLVATQDSDPFNLGSIIEAITRERRARKKTLQELQAVSEEDSYEEDGLGDTGVKLKSSLFF